MRAKSLVLTRLAQSLKAHLLECRKKSYLADANTKSQWLFRIDEHISSTMYELTDGLSALKHVPAAILYIGVAFWKK